MQITLPSWIGWIIGSALIAVPAIIWRFSRDQRIRALLVVCASAGITIVLSGRTLVLAVFSCSVALVIGTWWVTRTTTGRLGTTLWILFLLAVLIFSKALPFQGLLGPGVWIGISYLFFRLVHVTLDVQEKRLDAVSLPQLIIFALHPATLVAGPIDRIQHFIAEQASSLDKQTIYLNEGLWRIFFGLFKKVVLANLFFTIAAANDVTQTTPAQTIVWIWVIAYSFYIYFDFASYSDLAIGVGLLLGQRFPENFANPYASSSITKFWQTWHITLSTWLRDYVFFPLSRKLLKRFGSRYSTPIALVSQLTTMILCGLWHGLRFELAVWGMWHGLGLFIHNRWAAWERRFHLPRIPSIPAVVMTYLFVALGWTFFTLPFTHALAIMARFWGLR